MPKYHFQESVVLQIGPVYKPADIAEFADDLSELNNEVTIKYVRWDGPAAGGLVPEVALAFVIGIPATVLLTEITKDAYGAIKRHMAHFAGKGRTEHGAKVYAPFGIAVESGDRSQSIWFIIDDAIGDDQFTEALAAIPSVVQATLGERAFAAYGMPVVYTYNPKDCTWRDTTDDRDWRSGQMIDPD